MAIWCVANTTYTRLKLWCVNNHEFMVIEPGEIKPLLQGYSYLLIDKRYKNILDTLPEQVETFKAIIEDRAKKIMLDNFIELKIKNTVEPEPIDLLPEEGLRL